MFRRGQTELRIEKDGRGVLRQYIRDHCLEHFKIMAIGAGTASGSKRLLKRSTLIHRGCGDHALFVGNGIQARQFSCCQLHFSLPFPARRGAPISGRVLHSFFYQPLAERLGEERHSL